MAQVSVNPGQMFVPQHLAAQQQAAMAGHQPVTSQQYLPAGRGGVVRPQQPGGGGAGPGKDGGTGPGQAAAARQPDMPSPMAVTGHPILAGQPPHGGGPYLQYPQYPQPGQHPVVRMIMPGGPGGVPGGPAMLPGMMPVMSQHQAGEGPGQQPHWAGPGQPHPPPSGVPPPAMAATPPQHGTQPSTPAPSPGLGGVGGVYSHPPVQAGPASLPPSYPQPAQHTLMVVGPGGGVQFPGHGIPTSGGQPGPHTAHLAGQHLLGGPGQPQVAGQPVTSMAGMVPHFHQYMPGHPAPHQGNTTALLHVLYRGVAGGGPHQLHLLQQQQQHSQQ